MKKVEDVCRTEKVDQVAFFLNKVGEGPTMWNMPCYNVTVILRYYPRIITCTSYRNELWILIGY